MIDIKPLNIDRKATKKTVETVLKKYRIFLLSEDIEKHPQITPSYSLVPPSKTNTFYSTTESAAIENVDRQRERSEYLTRILNAVNRLEYIERALLIQRYMTKEEVYDYEVYMELGLGKTKYNSVKNDAMIRLAIALNIEIYEHE